MWWLVKIADCYVRRLRGQRWICAGGGHVKTREILGGEIQADRNFDISASMSADSE